MTICLELEGPPPTLAYARLPAPSESTATPLPDAEAANRLETCPSEPCSPTRDEALLDGASEAGDEKEGDKFTEAPPESSSLLGKDSVQARASSEHHGMSFMDFCRFAGSG